MSELSSRIERYHKILEPDFPGWLNEYINTPPMQQQGTISMTCGLIYSDMFDYNFYTSLDHSIGVALIVWHFTHDKIQTLAGLFHDIATPVFKHSVDYMNGDYMTQESTEAPTTRIIQNSPEIMKLLNRDGIAVSQIDNYHLYPIADNDTPGLAADRLEYTLSNPSITYGYDNHLTLDEVAELYNDLTVQKNELGLDELGFQTKSLARKFCRTACKMSIFYRDDATRYSMQLLADILKRLNSDGLITECDMYTKSEAEIIDLIKGSKYSHIFEMWQQAKRVKTSEVKPDDNELYVVHHEAKKRYIDPLWNGVRISNACKLATKAIDKCLAYDMDKYVYIKGIGKF